MGRGRSLIRNAFEEGAVIDTEEDIAHGLDKTRPKKELEEKVENGKTKVQIWVKKDTLEYQRKLSLLQIELIKLQNYVRTIYRCFRKRIDSCFCSSSIFSS